MTAPALPPRSGPAPAPARARVLAQARFEPVSYTHLDVYKRQVLALMAHGLTNSELAERLWVGEGLSLIHI